MKKQAQERKTLDKIYQALNLKGKLSNKLDPQQKELFEIISDIDEKSRMCLITGLNNKSITKTLSSAKAAYEKDNYLKSGLELVSIMSILSKTFEYQNVITQQLGNLKFEDFAKNKFKEQGGDLEDLRSDINLGMIKTAGLFDLLNSSKFYNLINKDRWKKLFTEQNPIIQNTKTTLDATETGLKEVLGVFDVLSNDLKKYDVMSYAAHSKECASKIQALQNKIESFLNSDFKPFVKEILPPVAAKAIEKVIVKEEIKAEPTKEIPLSVLSVQDLVWNLKEETKKVEEKIEISDKPIELVKSEKTEIPVSEPLISKDVPIEALEEEIVKEPVKEAPKKKKNNLDFLKDMNLKIDSAPEPPKKKVEPDKEKLDDDFLASIEDMMGLNSTPEPPKAKPIENLKPAESSNEDLQRILSAVIEDFNSFKKEVNGKDKKSDKYKIALENFLAKAEPTIAKATIVAPPTFNTPEELLNFRKLITFGLSSNLNALVGNKNLPEGFKKNLDTIKANIDAQLEGLKKKSSYEDLLINVNSLIDSNQLTKAASLIQEVLPKLSKKDNRYPTCIRLMFDLRK